MATAFGVHGRSLKVAPDVHARTGESVESGRYLTDGVTLYRYLRTIPSGLGELVELEDCRSLALTWLPVGQVRRLRPVLRPGRQ